jgi:sorting nexin-7/30/sorting nexin-8
MEENDEELEAKQTLLQNEIINKNFDKASFINFCLSKKENGEDLNAWSLAELEQLVKEFVASQNNNQPQPEPQQGNKNEVNKEDLEKMEKFNAEEPKVFKERTIECRKLEKTVLNDKKINITIKNPKEMAGGIFGNNYILYEVQTDPVGWVVTRRFSDFVLLRQLLAKYFPSYNIPPLPNKKYTARRFDSDFIMKRMKFLNLFINNIVRSEDFKASEILVSFLSIPDRANFE